MHEKNFPHYYRTYFYFFAWGNFFQVLWIKQSLQDKEQQFEESIKMVTVTAGNDLVEEKGNLSPFDKQEKYRSVFSIKCISIYNCT